jgi:hypothetical protein
MPWYAASAALFMGAASVALILWMLRMTWHRR